MQEANLKNNQKRILILSNACFSDSDSNGRTLQQLFKGVDPDSLAQFFVYGTPDFNICNHYYQVSDRDAMYSFLKQRECGEVVSQQKYKIHTAGNEAPAKSEQENTKKKIQKTPLSMLVRELVWRFGRWNGKELLAWIDQFEPGAVFVSLADNTFLTRLAVQIVQRYRIPLFVYSTESYYFKNYNYLTKHPSLLYGVFHSWIKKAYKNVESYVKSGIFNTPLLAETYGQHFRYPCKCIYSPSNIDFIDRSGLSGKMKISYLGNLGVGRHAVLVEFANILGQVLPEAKLDVYGNLPENEMEKASLLRCKYIDYKGFISYGDVVRVIHESTLLIHAELDDAFYSKDLKYAFSTKIADSVCSGTPLLIYARRDLAETDFLIRNECAFVASDREELSKVLRTALTDVQERKRITQNAEKTRKTYFSGIEGIKDLIEL